MDPDATLSQLLELARLVISGNADPTDAFVLAEYTIDLDAWIKRGGFLPAAWTTTERKA